jgi:CspA family cold shock protein
VFVHITKLEEIGLRRLYEGQKISYEIYDDRGRTAAGNLEIL